MTERDNVRSMLSGTSAHHLPLDVWLTEPMRDRMEAHTGTRDEVAALGLCVERIGPKYPFDEQEWREAYEAIGVHLGPHSVIGTLGIVNDVPPAETVGEAYHLLEMRHPLEEVRSVAQLQSLPWPDIYSPEPYAHIPAAVVAAHERGVAAIGQMDCTAFEMSWYLRGMEPLYLDLLDGTGVADWLLDWFTRRAEIAVRHYVRAGVDIVWLGDDVGTQRGLMMAVPFWRKHLKPRLKRVIQAVRETQVEPVWIAYHSDGDVGPILDELIEIGIDILNPVQPECMPVRDTIDRYRDRLAFWGMVGTQTTMPFGSVEDVRGVVADLREMAVGGARIVISPTHTLEPDVPWENLATLVAEAKQPLHKVGAS